MRCISSIRCVSVTALTGLCCSPYLASGYPARNGFVCCGSGHSICFVRSGCFGCHYYFYRFRSGRDLVCSLSSTGIVSRVSIGGHWCDDCLCLLVSGPTAQRLRRVKLIIRSYCFSKLPWVISECPAPFVGAYIAQGWL